MSNLSITSSSDSTTLSVPKLRDDGSNWMDYEPRIRRAMGSKGLWMHIEGIAIAPKPYAIVNSIPVLSDGKTKAMDEQLETREARIIEFGKREYLAQHIILSTTSIHLGAIIKNLKTAKEMWDKVKNDATTLTRQTSWPVCVFTNSDDPATHLTELKQHFELMTKQYENLVQMGSTISDTRFTTMIMSSLLPSY